MGASSTGVAAARVGVGPVTGSGPMGAGSSGAACMACAVVSVGGVAAVTGAAGGGGSVASAVGSALGASTALAGAAVAACATRTDMPTGTGSDAAEVRASRPPASLPCHCTTPVSTIACRVVARARGGTTRHIFMVDGSAQSISSRQEVRRTAPGGAEPPMGGFLVWMPMRLSGTSTVDLPPPRSSQVMPVPRPEEICSPAYF